MPRKTFMLTSEDAIGEKNNFAKLKEKDIIEIREMWKTSNFTQKAIAKKFNVNPSTISCIISRKRWAHI